MHDFREGSAIRKERADPVAAAHAERRESASHIVRARMQLGVREPRSAGRHERQTIRGGGGAPGEPDEQRVRRAVTER